MTQVSPDMVERAAHGVMVADGCGLTVNGQRVLCDHPDASPEVRNRGCSCRSSATAALTAALGIPPADGHGYSGAFTAKEFNERALDHEKAARNGLAAGPNVSYVRTFQACAVALRLAADLLPTPTPEQQQ